MTDGLLLLHTGVTLAMAGVIWFVQVVHYPLLASVGAERFAAYEAEHVRRTGWVVGPLMLAEAGSAVWLLLHAAGSDAVLARIGFALLLGIWLSTGLLQVPCHRRLAVGFDVAVCRRLVRTNWLRTAGWSARAGIALLLLSR